MSPTLSRPVAFGLPMLGFLLLLGGGVLLGRFGERLEVWEQTAAWLVLILTVSMLLRPGLAALVGPVLAFDAVRTARRARQSVLRSLYAFVLLIVLFLIYTESFGKDIATGLSGIMDEQTVDPARITQFTERFFLTFIVVQFLMVMVLTPAFVAGAIAEEREKGTLALLLTTDLFPREIIFGKLVSRLGHLILLLLAGVPVLSLLQLLGGVDPVLLTAGFSITLLTALGIGSLAMVCSVNCNRPRDAVFLTYVSVAGYQLFTGLFCGILSINIQDSLIEYLMGIVTSGNLIFMYLQITRLSESGTLSSDLLLLLLQYVIFHGTLLTVCLGWSMALLRRPQLPGREEPTPPTTIPEIIADMERRLRPKLDDRAPMIWKECHVERGIALHPVGRQIVGMVTVIFVSIAATILACGLLIQLFEQGSQFLLNFLQICIPTVATVAMLGGALRAAGSFTNERERQTLDSLLTTQLTNGEILIGKFCGCLWQVRSLLGILLLLLCLGLITGSVFPLWVLVEAIALAIHLLFAISVGMYCSLFARTTLRATVMTIVVLLLVTVGHWFLFLLSAVIGSLNGVPGVTLETKMFHLFGMTPPLTQATFLVSFAEVLKQGGVITTPEQNAAMTGLLQYIWMTAALWVMTSFRMWEVTGRRR